MTDFLKQPSTGNDSKAMPRVNQSQNPIKTCQYAAVVKGHHTDFVCSKFANLTFICVTQYKKLGTLIKVTKDVQPHQPDKEELFTVELLLGKDEQNLQVLARALAQDISAEKNFLFSLALKDTDKETLLFLRSLVLKHLVS